MSNLKMAQEMPLIAALAPVSQAAGARSTAWLPAKDYFNFMAAISVGVLGAGATVDVKVEQATSDAGVGAKDVAGKALVQVNASAKTAQINFTHNDFDMGNSYAWYRLTITVGTAASLTSLMVFGGDARYEKSANSVADQNI